MIVGIRVVADEWRPFMRKFPGVFKKTMGRAMYKIARRSAYNMQMQLRHNHNIWTGDLFESIKAKKRSDYRSEVHMLKYGVYLDSMKPHFVPFTTKPYKQGRLKTGKKSITAWATSHGFDVRKRKGLFVRPHPFIDMAWRKTDKQANQIVNRELRRSIR